MTAGKGSPDAFPFRIVRVVAAAFLLSLIPALAADRAAVRKQLEELAAGTTSYPDLALSPDGRQIAWVQAGPDGKGTLYRQALGTPGARPESLGAGEGPSWSPGSDRLAFIRMDGTGASGQLWVQGAARAAAPIGTFPGGLADPKWSPSGREIAVLVTEGGRVPAPTEALEPRLGVIQSVIRDQRIAVVGAEGGASRIASQAGLHVYEYGWSPDGSAFAAVAGPGPGNANWWTACLYRMDARTGRAERLYAPHGQIAQPRWSPDGKSIAFLEGLMSDEEIPGGDVMVLPATGEVPRNLTPGRRTTPTQLAWTARGSLVVTEFAAGNCAMVELGQDGRVTPLWSGIEPLGDHPVRLSRDGAVSAVVREGFDRPPEIWAGATGAWAPVTSANRGLRPAWGRSEWVTWSNEGLELGGWLLHPGDERPGTTYPMVVEVHGGPSYLQLSEWAPDWSAMTLSAAGYFVFLPNPRGSYGSGEAFVRANVKDFGGGDLRDILAGVERVTGRFPVDGDRVGIQGWSYGGYMTMWAVTQTRRFKAAVAGAGIADLKSYYGQNDIGQWLIPFFGASVYDDPAVYAKSSPIEFIRNAATPTLVLVGERDGECPAPQSFEFWHALKTLGVPCELVVFPGEGHIFANPGNRDEKTWRTVAWFDKYLGVRGGATP